MMRRVARALLFLFGVRLLSPRQGRRAGLRLVCRAGRHRRHDDARHPALPRLPQRHPPAALVVPDGLAPGRGPERRARHGQGRRRVPGVQRALPALQTVASAHARRVGGHDRGGRAPHPAGPALLPLGGRARARADRGLRHHGAGAAPAHGLKRRW